MKKLWNNNRVLFFLIVILIICFVAIIVVASTFFYKRNSSEYGERLADIEKHPFTTEIKNAFREEIEKNDHVKELKYNIFGRIIYVNISFDEKISLDDAKKLVESNIKLFTQEILDYYDLDFIVKSDNFTKVGAKNAVSDNIVWNNNRVVEKEKTEEE